jgi:hypothetical protein
LRKYDYLKLEALTFEEKKEKKCRSAHLITGYNLAKGIVVAAVVVFVHI